MIPLNKPTIVRKDLEYVLNCLITERIEEGELTREFEKSICHFLNLKYSVATNSFSSSLHLALLALSLQPDDEIILSAYTPSYILNVFRYIQVKPVLADIDLSSYNMDIKQVEQKISGKTKAILLNHAFGLPADIDAFLNLNIPIIEDCSYAFGSEYTSAVMPELKLTGSFGIFSLFSFDTDTNITTGNGAMMVSNSRDLVLNAKKYKLNPLAEEKDMQIRYDYRISDISSALGLSQLKIVKKLIDRRVEIANYYSERFQRSKNKIIRVPENMKSVYSKYTLLLEGNLEKTIRFMRQNKVDADRPVPSPAYSVLDPEGREYPNAFQCYNKLIEIPVYPSLKKKEIERVANTFLKVF
ncbi:MAG: DegT/DnrJ/EryC1/StrS aminotransferase family protein [bacterium]|nr:DegT/DnrJ/EryC1/StrS aminotransferase family protein [bacterium]